MNRTLRMGHVFRGDGIESTEGKTTFLVSDDSLDRYSTRIVQDWDQEGRLAAFMSNPVAPWSHDYSQAPLGRWADLRVVDLGDGRRGTLATLEWDMEDEDAARIAGKYARGMMSAVSVGFRTGKVTALRDLDEGHPWRADRGEMLSMNSLLEISPVTIPGNPNALAQRGKLSWAGVALMETAPEEVRAELLRLLTEDAEVKALVREMAGDCRTVEEAVHEARATHPLGWMIRQKQ